MAERGSGVFGLQSLSDFQHTKGTGWNKIPVARVRQWHRHGIAGRGFALFASPRLLLGQRLEEAVAMRVLANVGFHTAPRETF